MKDSIAAAWRVMTIENGHDIEKWYQGNKFGRHGDLPAKIWYENGQKTRERWYKDDRQHRDSDLLVEI
jgi:hypothetical protein